MDLNIIDSNPIGDLFCRMCVTTKLFLLDKDEAIYKCKTCGSMFKYNKPVRKAELNVDPELNNEANSSIFFYKPAKKETKNDLPEVGGNSRLIKDVDVK